LSIFDHSNSIPILEKINPAYDIVWFGRPLWGSQWLGQTETDQEGRFGEILCLAKSKLTITGGALKWSEIQDDIIKWRVALALLACTAALCVSPTSSVAPKLVKPHMATLVAVDDECEWHLITYPSEPLLPEASMELLSEKGVEIVVLKELQIWGHSWCRWSRGIGSETVALGSLALSHLLWKTHQQRDQIILKILDNNDFIDNPDIMEIDILMKWAEKVN
jgi:hypothetical protein